MHGVVFPSSEPGICEMIDTIFIGVPLNMGVCKNDLFVGDFREPMIVHYNLMDGKTERFLSAGRGPKETLPPVILYANPLGNNVLYRYSKQAFDLGYYPVDSLFVYVPLLNNLSYVFQNIIPYEKDCYLAVGEFVDGYRYHILDAEGKVIDKFGDYPDFLAGEDLIPFDARSMFHQVEFANNYNKRKLVASSSHIMDIIDYSSNIKNESIKRILLAPYDYDYSSGNFLSAHAKNGIVTGSVSVACNNSYIFLLFYPWRIGQKNQSVKDEIWVFDWDGKPVKKISYDINLTMIAADPSESEFVYGLAYYGNRNDEYYQIVRIKF